MSGSVERMLINISGNIYSAYEKFKIFFKNILIKAFYLILRSVI